MFSKREIRKKEAKREGKRERGRQGKRAVGRTKSGEQRFGILIICYLLS